MEVHDIVQEAGIKTIPKKTKCKKPKWLSKEALKIAEIRREDKGKGEKEGYLLPWLFSWVCLVLVGFQLKLLHDGVVTHLEPDILECEVKWTLGSITMNKASGSDGIPVELFQILKDDAVTVLHSICQQIWKTQKWP